MGTKVVSKIVNLFTKPGKSFLVHSDITPAERFFCKAETIFKDGKKALTRETEATLGDASVWISGISENQLQFVKEEVGGIFGKLGSVVRIDYRAKSGASVFTKLKRIILEKFDKTFHSLDEAYSFVRDAVGSRVILKSLPRLKESEIRSMIRKMHVDGVRLTEKQNKLLYDIIYENPVKSSQREEGFALMEQFVQPLIEKRSGEAVDTLTLGILRHRMDCGEFTFKELSESGLLNEKLINRLLAERIDPIEVERISNYRGAHGFAEFSNNQIRQLSIALDFKNINGKKVPIYSDARGLSARKFSAEDLAYAESEAIKVTGYRSAQVNVKHYNGANGEVQFRGDFTNEYCEKDHALMYDLLMGKGTEGADGEAYAKALKSLSQRDRSQYNLYKESWFNYFNRLELGLPAKKPKLNIKFNKILSEECGTEMYETITKAKKNAERGFVPHFVAVA